MIIIFYNKDMKNMKGLRDDKYSKRDRENRKRE